MISELKIWREEHAKLKNTAPPPQGTIGLAKYINAQVTGKLTFKSSKIVFSKATFTWNMPVFVGAMMALAAPSVEPVTPATTIAKAWAAAAQASLMVISPGSSMSPPPPGTNGVVGVAVAIVDPPSIAIAMAGIIADLLAAPKPSKQIYDH